MYGSNWNACRRREHPHRGFGKRHGGAWGGRWRRERVFDPGDLRLIVLKLIAEKPRHGYEVMKALEERMHGCYSPSPGTVYPTLQWLEDEGLVRAQEVDGKKVYAITDAGRRFLDEHRDVVEEIFDRVRDAVDDVLGGAMGDLNHAIGHLVKTAYRTGWRSRDDAKRKKVAEILGRAAAEIEALG